MRAQGVRFVSEPRTERYGRVVVFLDVAGNRWDLLGPATEAAARPTPEQLLERIDTRGSASLDEPSEDTVRRVRDHGE